MKTKNERFKVQIVCQELDINNLIAQWKKSYDVVRKIHFLESKLEKITIEIHILNQLVINARA